MLFNPLTWEETSEGVCSNQNHSLCKAAIPEESFSLSSTVARLNEQLCWTEKIMGDHERTILGVSMSMFPERIHLGCTGEPAWLWAAPAKNVEGN